MYYKCSVLLLYYWYIMSILVPKPVLQYRYFPQPNPATLSPPLAGLAQISPHHPTHLASPRRPTPAVNPSGPPRHSSSSRVSPTLANPIAPASSHGPRHRNHDFVLRKYCNNYARQQCKQ